jgi:hypothetical protein
MKNIIFILIFLYIICNGCIENFSVGGSDINISGSLTLPYIDKCINQDECMKIWSDFWPKCQRSQSPPDENCCKQLNTFYPMYYNACKEIYENKDVELVSEDRLLKNYNICNN